jgi:CIC family chloride channel protein
VEQIKNSKRNVFPVLDEYEHLLGVIILDDIRDVMFHQEQYDTTYVKELMTQPPCILDVNEEMHDIMRKFDAYNMWNLPVTEANRYIGFISKSTIFTKYRSLLIKQSKQIYT